MRKLTTILIVLTFAVGLFVFYSLHAFGEFLDLDSPHFDGACRRIPGLVGPEDITIHPETGMAYISAADRIAELKGGHPAGGVYAYDLTQSRPTLLNLTPDTDQTFHPHGMSLFVTDQGPDVLYLINHSEPSPEIIVYDLTTPTTLTEKRTLKDPLLTAPNDLTAVDRDIVYITNDHRFKGRTRLLPLLETLLRLPITNVILFDGEDFSVAASGISMPNGINANSEGTQIYVDSPTWREMLIYERDLNTGVLEFERAVPLEAAVDNIERDQNGDLWVAGHPRLLDIFRAISGRLPYSGSQVFRIRMNDTGPNIDEIYLGTGEQISASSVAARWGNRLLIGSITSKWFLDCRIRTATLERSSENALQETSSATFWNRT